MKIHHQPNALHLTRPSRSGCNPRVAWAGSLSVTVRIMRVALSVALLLALVGCTPPTITRKEYDQRCQEAINLHNTLIGQVHYQGSKEGYDYFRFEPFGSGSHQARIKEGEVGLKKRFPYSENRKNWVVAFPDWAGTTNLVIQTRGTNTKC